MTNFEQIDAASLNLTTSYMPRSRLDDLFSKMADCKLIYVIAGAGYGKSRAVHHYIEEHPEDSALWIHLGESDNTPSRFWENFLHAISLSSPEISDHLRKVGFPETLSRFSQFSEIFANMKRPSHKMFFVFDDLHLINSKKTLEFIQRCVYIKIPNISTIIISRNEPDLNIVPLMSKGKVGNVTENELRFTTAEATAFFQKKSIHFSLQDISQTLEATNGWPLAINILSLIMKKKPDNFHFAIESMMQNINKFLEIEAWDDFSEAVQKSLANLSLLPDLPAALLKELLDGAVLGKEVLQNAHGLASFIWYGNLTNEIKIHPLYLEFLQSKQDILSDEEKLETFEKAARWCIENDFYTDAMKYCAKSDQFEQMIKILVSHSSKLPRETSDYFLEIIGGLDPESSSGQAPQSLEALGNQGGLSSKNQVQDRLGRNDESLLFLKNIFVPLLLVGIGRYEDAKNLALAVIEKWKHVDDPISSVLIHFSYTNLAYIDMYICTSAHEYKTLEYMEKSAECLELTATPFGSATAAFANPDVRSFACLVGVDAALSEIDDYLNITKQTALLIEKTALGLYAGYDDLVACECAFYKNQPDIARKYAHSAIMTAREKRQYTIEIMAESYLLRIAVMDGDASLAKKILTQMQSHLDNEDFKHRHLYFDLYIGIFYALIGLPDKVPFWLIMDEKEEVSEIHIPVRELIVSTLFYISAKKYEHALTVLSNSYPRAPHERFLFGEIKLTLLTAIARLRTGDTHKALVDFKKAYDMSFDGVHEMFFVERGRELHPLIAAALKHEDCGIPQAWLKKIDRRASIFAKKAAVIAIALKGRRHDREPAALSSREREVLRDLYHGLSREEIAANQYLSINTVKKILQSIYVKLDAQNSVDAVRIALEKKLVG